MPAPSDSEVRPANKQPLLLGHRGARAVKSIPENTIASFDRALADGADGFEFDVRLSSDGAPVICHDPKTGKLEIANTTSAELKLPTLNDVLVRYRETAFFDIELKVAGIEKIVIESLRKYAPKRGFVVSSFLPEVLQTLHTEDANIPLGLICETKSQLERWRELPVNYVIPHRRLLRQKLLEQLKNAGKRVFVWTVNDADGMRRFAEWEVEGLISDNPAKLSRKFKG